MKINFKDDRIDKTLRELIATASGLAFEYSGDTKDAYNLTRQAFVEILKDASPSRLLKKEFSCFDGLSTNGKSSTI